MQLTPLTADDSAYLAADSAVDHTHPLVRETAARLSAGADDLAEYARAAYEFVRDTITHSADADDPRITWRASDVLAQRTGICHAKSHALAALLRAEGVPVGFCYQKLDVLHGLIAMRLPGGRWIRQDPRGNKPGVDAQFRLDREQLAWPVRPEKGECDYPVLHSEPHPVILRALRRATDRAELWRLLDTAL
ncbi:MULTISPECIES: transglutaminase family protein [unclassified Streptomyces]|uniref:transglutaminase-like domain-containing protein n=1 Tax=unclassified Streptomyces TaxID=2593676 RepID=UPI002DD95E0B|nr:MULTISPECIES: transglutaminase family protein [unclassified Streptomyces]WSA90306.1 transglutaminase family protein [Streptomyces sp. NBC_01795]WSB74532.1 transglutaminase family protein [Streptomyces sp. NBC_01775]WSS17084.1 transglutaminase family protein [Streptomyces sp. NBC_01186]WSS45827.1 transglutaminase family protein [Streptomyces sp. NBC_01187]